MNKLKEKERLATDSVIRKSGEPDGHVPMKAMNS